MLSDRSDANSIVELFRHNLLSATSLRNPDGTIVLRTFDRLDPLSLEPTQRPAAVTYFVEDQGGIPCLLRRQATTDDPVLPPALIALIACHVRKIEIKALRPNQERKDQFVELTPKDDRVPAVIRLHIEFDDSSAAINQVMCLR